MQTVEFPIYLNMTEHGLNMTYFRVFGNPRLLSEKYWHKNRIVLKSTEPEKLHLIFSNITNITRSEEESGEVNIRNQLHQFSLVLSNKTKAQLNN